MNERIKELAEQCRIEECNSNIGDLIEFGIDVGDLNEFGFDEEKFAQLIIKECISVMKSTVDESIDFERKLDETSSWIESDIKKHFGV